MSAQQGPPPPESKHLLVTGAPQLRLTLWSMLANPMLANPNQRIPTHPRHHRATIPRIAATAQQTRTDTVPHLCLGSPAAPLLVSSLHIRCKQPGACCRARQQHSPNPLPQRCQRWHGAGAAHSSEPSPLAPGCCPSYPAPGSSQSLPCGPSASPAGQHQPCWGHCSAASR